jgi:hypothetical protein
VKDTLNGIVKSGESRWQQFPIAAWKISSKQDSYRGRFDKKAIGWAQRLWQNLSPPSAICFLRNLFRVNAFKVGFRFKYKKAVAAPVARLLTVAGDNVC